MKNSRIYVGNIPFSTSESDLRSLFAPRKITNVKLCTDRETGKPRGFGFVEFATDEEATTAISQLDKTQYGGRSLVVNLAHEKKNSGRREPGDRERRDERATSRNW